MMTFYSLDNNFINIKEIAHCYYDETHRELVIYYKNNHQHSINIECTRKQFQDLKEFIVINLD